MLGEVDCVDNGSSQLVDIDDEHLYDDDEVDAFIADFAGGEVLEGGKVVVDGECFLNARKQVIEKDKGILDHVFRYGRGSFVSKDFLDIYDRVDDRDHRVALVKKTCDSLTARVVGGHTKSKSVKHLFTKVRNRGNREAFREGLPTSDGKGGFVYSSKVSRRSGAGVGRVGGALPVV